jgi:hypothetical protein
MATVAKIHEKAFFFSERRPFFELDDTITDHVFGRIEQRWEDYLRRGPA